MSKDDIISQLATLKRKRGVRRLKEVKVRPYTDQLDPPPLSCPRSPQDWVGFVFVDDSDETVNRFQKNPQVSVIDTDYRFFLRER